MIHGYGSNAQDLFSFTPYLPQHYTIISLEAPIALPMGGFAWFPLRINLPLEEWIEVADIDAVKKSFLATLDFCIEKENLDSEKISLLGFSQGAMLGWTLALTNPQQFKRLIALSGFVIPNTFELPPNHTQLPKIYAAHGIHDMVIPVEMARKTIQPLTETYSEIQYREFPDGHEVSPANFNQILEWLSLTEVR